MTLRERDWTLPESAASAESRWEPAAALAYVGGDRQLLEELLAIFVEDGSAHIDALRDGIGRTDGAEVTRVAHLLKGRLRTLGAVTAAALAEKLEELARRGSLDGAPRLLAALEGEQRRLLARIVDGGWR